MPLYTDELGISYTASRPESVAHFNDVIGAYLSSRATVMLQLESLIEDDPHMPIARCLRGYLFKLAADPRFTPPLAKIVRSLNKVKAQLTEREQQHIRALAHWAENDIDATVKILEDILVDYPTDMLALRIVHYLHFYAGASSAIRDSVGRSLSRWDRNQPFYGYLLGMHAFGLEESGDYRQAEATGREAVELNRDDIWAAHAVTHVYQMQSRFLEGVTYMEALLPDWRDANNFVYHMQWHKALYYIGLGELSAALAIYDEHLAHALDDDFYLDVCNAASLLWRLEMLGIDVGNRWEPLNDISKARLTDNELLFSTIHYLMTPARLKDDEAIEIALAHFMAWSEEGTTQGEICRSVGLPLARAIADLGHGEKARASATLAAIQDKIVLIGGSHAQRELFNQLREHAAH